MSDAIVTGSSHFPYDDVDSCGLLFHGLNEVLASLSHDHPCFKSKAAFGAMISSSAGIYYAGVDIRSKGFSRSNSLKLVGNSFFFLQGCLIYRSFINKKMNVPAAIFGVAADGTKAFNALRDEEYKDAAMYIMFCIGNFFSLMHFLPEYSDVCHISWPRAWHKPWQGASQRMFSRMSAPRRMLPRMSAPQRMLPRMSASHRMFPRVSAGPGAFFCGLGLLVSFTPDHWWKGGKPD